MLGHMAYLLEGMKRLSAIRSYPMRITYDDTTIVDDFIFGMVTNSASVGGFKRITGKTSGWMTAFRSNADQTSEEPD